MQLDRLIREYANGRTYEQLEIDCGRAITAQQIWTLATEPRKTFPYPKTIRGLARALNLSEWTVILSCAESLGLSESYRAQVEDMFPPEVRQLTDRQVRVIQQLITELVAPRE